MTIVAGKHLYLRGLEANRATVTPMEGEPLFCIDSGKLYIGDGTTAGGNSINVSETVFRDTGGSDDVAVIMELASLTTIILNNVGNATYSIQTNSFKQGSILKLVKALDSSAITLTTLSGVMFLPDNSSSDTHTMSEGTHYSVSLIKSGNDFHLY